MYFIKMERYKKEPYISTNFKGGIMKSNKIFIFSKEEMILLLFSGVKLIDILPGINTEYIYVFEKNSLEFI